MAKAIHSAADGGVFIHATNISQGGGKSLLNALLAALPLNFRIVAQLDRRMPLPANALENMSVREVPPTIFNRIRAEWWLAKNVKSNDLVICFGSLPPLFKLKGKSVVFVQNRYLIEKNNLAGFSLKTRLRLMFERTWLRLASSNADEFIVQTPAMKAVMQRSGYLEGQPVHVRPFTADSSGYQRTHQPKKNEAARDFDFVYVASGEPHKNHRQLVEAWCLLAEQNLYPSLCLTLDKDASTKLCSWIEEQKAMYRLKLTNVGLLSHSQVLELYGQAGALIYPSCLESFGLPLIEASQAGLPILAAELDYVRDVLDPVETFDPDSPVSIARAVKRYWDVEEPALQLSDAKTFLQQFLEDSTNLCNYCKI